MFPITVEWFGMPDDRKRHNDQLEYRLKGMTNDQLRQDWMSATVPLCESLGLKVPAHWDDAQQKYVLDYPFPCRYDAAAKHWLFEEGEITWDEVFQRWKARGPMNEIYVESVRRSHGPMSKMLAVSA
jgi:ring-1,2-phenylacetyl-CoA epoxidase subunit PaaA